MYKTLLLSLLIVFSFFISVGQDHQNYVLNPKNFQHHIDGFNRADNELYKNIITNKQAWQFLKNNIPFFECPDKELEKIYYFRWWTYRKHIRKIKPSEDWGEHFQRKTK